MPRTQYLRLSIGHSTNDKPTTNDLSDFSFQLHQHQPTSAAPAKRSAHQALRPRKQRAHFSLAKSYNKSEEILPEGR